MTVGKALKYDSEHFYVNELRTRGSDPGAVYYDGEQMKDTYQKLSQYYAGIGKGAEFLEKYGTQEDYVQAYGDRFFMAETTWRDEVSSSEMKKKYGILYAQYASFLLFSSTDLSDWRLCGNAGGNAFVSQYTTWATLSASYSWAPELIRDPVSGLFLIYFNTVSVEGTAKNKLPNSSEHDRMQLTVGYSETPTGPYTLLTGDIYYRYVCAYTDQNEIKTVSSGGKTYAVYRNDIQSGDTPLTEMQNGEFVNLNGESTTQMDPLFNFSYYHVGGYMGIEEGKGVVDIYTAETTLKCVDGVHNRGSFPVIDAHPFIDSNGTMFVYFVLEGKGGNTIWVVRMKDVVTPEWSSLTRVTAPKFSSIYHTDANPVGETGRNMQDLSQQGEGNVNEGVFVVERNGFFYLFYSRYGLIGSNQNNTEYDVLLAVADNPFGPFIKVPSVNPIVGYVAGNDYMVGTGHCSMVKAGDEYWCIYCANPGLMGRSIGADKVTFLDYDNLTFLELKTREINANNGKTTLTEAQMESCFQTHNGQDYVSKGDSEAVLEIPFGNGPTYSPQPIPAVSNEYHNVLQDSDCHVTILSGDESTAKYLTDGMFSSVSRAYNYETVGTETELKIQITFDSPKTVQSILLYQSFRRSDAIKSVSAIEFELAEKPSWYPEDRTYYSTCVINGLELESYAFGSSTVRYGVSANAVFNEIKIHSLTITVRASDKLVENQNAVRLSEITLMGR